MPRRRVPDEQLHGYRIELNQKERELVETGIYVNGFAKTVQGIGTAIGGLGLAGGILIATAIYKEELEGAWNWFEDKADLGKQEWIDKNITQEKYNEHVNQRNEFWIREAKKQGRYGPAIGDHQNLAWWYALPPNGNADALTFSEWEKEYAGEPAMTFDEWAVNDRNREAQKRKGIIPILIRLIPGGEEW